MDKSKEHAHICSELTDTYIRKNNDYGNSFGESFDEWGLIAGVVRMDDKMRRLKQLIKGNPAQVKDESIRDTLMDLANYSIMAVMEMDAKKTQCPQEGNKNGY